MVKKYYLKNEKELNKKPQNLNVDTKKIDNHDVSDNSNKKIEPIFEVMFSNLCNFLQSY